VRASPEAPPVDLAQLTELYPTWGLEILDDGRVRTGPLDQLTTNGPPTATVTLLPADWGSKRGSETGRRHVVESAAEFDVRYERSQGYAGLWHTGGANRIIWSGERIPRRVALTATAEPQRRWVHSRFLLRHLNAAFLFERQGREPFHAVIGTIAASRGGGGILIHGASGSGKTYLWQRLHEAGLVTAMPEDDCALIGRDWDALCLLPERDRLVDGVRVPIRAIVALAGDSDEPETTDGEAFLALAATTGVSWPAPWLPGGDLRPVPATLPPPTVPILRVGERRATDATIAAIAGLLED
jgi:hypothetical protein